MEHRRASILVVDDEPTIAEVVSRYLQQAGYAVATAPDGLEAVRTAATLRPDLVVLDLMLPGLDGLEVMRRIRDARTRRPAIVLLTAKGDESDRITGLRLGADDYVVKPFSPRELVARVDAVLRRIDTVAAPDPDIVAGDLVIAPASRRVHVGDDEATLTHLEFDLLHFLARHPGQAFSRDQLMDHVWHHTFYSDTATVTVHIRRLRAKLEPDPRTPRLIETVWGVGYRFAGSAP